MFKRIALAAVAAGYETTSWDDLTYPGSRRP